MVAAAAALAGAVPGSAGAQGAQADEVPEAVIAPRDLRMSLAGVIAPRLGCFGEPGDLCVGTVQARLREPVRAPASRARRAPLRTWPPFTLGRRGFSAATGRGRVVRLQFYPRGGYLARLAGRLPVNLTVLYDTRARRGLRTQQEIYVYVSPAQRYRRLLAPSAPGPLDVAR